MKTDIFSRAKNNGMEVRLRDKRTESVLWVSLFLYNLKLNKSVFEDIFPCEATIPHNSNLVVQQAAAASFKCRIWVMSKCRIYGM